jgi:putative transposase
MRAYIRNRTPGGIWFFTVNLAERRGNTLLVDRIDALGAAIRRSRDEHPFDMLAFVVLPDHLHCIWQLPAGDSDYPTRWRLIKSRFSRSLASTERRNPSRLAKSERGIWQRRYWEHLIRDADDLRAHLDDIHFNSVKHGHVADVAQWPHSSFHRHVRAGLLPRDWAK